MPEPTSPSFAALLLASHERLVGRPLTDRVWGTDAEAAQWLYTEAPFGLLAHDASADPLFTYANETAQTAFGYPWAEFTSLPSRLSAVQDAQEDRNRFVQAVTEHGYATGYRGRRVARTGAQFWIEDVTMWDLVDGAGVRQGQAAVFHAYRPV